MKGRTNKIKKIIRDIAVVGLAMSMVTSSVYVTAEVESTNLSYAYSIGTDYSSFFHGGIDTSEDAEYAATIFGMAGYKSYYNVKPTISYMEGNAPDGRKRLESSIVFLSGHGSHECVAFNYKNKGGEYATGIVQGSSGYSASSGYTYVGVDDLDLSDTKLYVLAACQTASTTEGITRDIVREAGAETAIGWSKSVGTSSHTQWLKRFCDKLAQGYSVGDSRMYADSFTYEDSNVKSGMIYGNVSLTICSSNTKSIMNTYDERNILDKPVDIPVTLSKNELQEELLKILASLGQNIKDKEYLLKCNDEVIDLIYVKNGIETIEGYTFILDNRCITSVYNNMLDESTKISFEISRYSRSATMLNNVSDCDEVSFLEKARNEINDEYMILEQSGKILYDSTSGQYLYYVITDYQTVDGLYGRNEHHYEIN